MTSNELDEFKTQLGPFAQRYTDEQLVQIHRELLELASIIVDTYLEAPEVLQALIAATNDPKMDVSHNK